MALPTNRDLLNTSHEMLVRLDERVDQLMRMVAEVTRDNKVRNGRLEKLESAHREHLTWANGEVEALGQRISEVQHWMTDRKKSLSEAEIERVREKERMEQEARDEHQRMKIETKFYWVGAGALTVLVAVPGLVNLVHLFVH